MAAVCSVKVDNVYLVAEHRIHWKYVGLQIIRMPRSATNLILRICQCPLSSLRSIIIYTLLFIWSEIDINFRSSHHVSSVVSIDECSPNIEEQ